jgi:general secretion pathway protein J
MDHPRSAWRDSLKGARPAVRHSRTHGIRGCGIPRRKRPADILGFTLIELLVAITILSLLALLSWRSIDGMTRTQTYTQQRADALMRLQAGLGQWVADLDAVIDTGEVTALSFDGQVLRLTRRDSAERELHSPGVRVVAWTRHSSGAYVGQWARWTSPPLVRRDELARAWQRAEEWGRRGVSSATGGDTAIALFPVDQWEMFYHRGEAWTHPQSSVGTENTGGEVVERSGLPNGVRLVLTLPAGQSISGTLVRDWVRPALQAAGS